MIIKSHVSLSKVEKKAPKKVKREEKSYQPKDN